jgi:hypothetical protein
VAVTQRIRRPVFGTKGRGSNLSSRTDLGTANLTGVHSENIAGTPAPLPNGWGLYYGNLIGP